MFMQLWTTGETVALNPLACLANSLAIIGGTQVLIASVAHITDESPAWLDLVRPFQQLGLVAFFVLMMHVPLRLLGGRAAWTTSLAAGLFVTTGPMVPLYMTRNIAFLFLRRSYPHSFILHAIALVLGLSLMIYLTRALAGAHRIAWWRALASFAIGTVAAVVVGGLSKLAIAKP